MSLLSLHHIALSFGGPALLEDVNFAIEDGERVCLVGRNGMGKSSLLKLIAGQLQADSGEVRRHEHLRLAELPQQIPEQLGGSVYDCVASGLGQVGELLKRYHQYSESLAHNANDATLASLERAQHELEALGGWEMTQRIETVISQLSLPADSRFESLSGGLKRRVLLAQALVQNPNLLLLDEPTNHLDIEAIEWLEQFLLNFNGSLLFITHDRAFLERLATRIIELDRGQLTSWPGDFATYQRRKAEALETEARHNALFDKKLAQEEAWIRQGIKARRTRNEGRVRALKQLREERRERRNLTGNAKLTMQDAARSGRLVVEAEAVSFSYQDTPVIKDFSTTILRGDKIGIIGPNGVGKTTLINLLLGKLQPTDGTLKLGSNIEIGYFDQHRSQIDPEKTVIDNLAEGRSEISINGKPRHVISYLQDFLFQPERARQPVKALSGGERNRLLLAKLFSKPCNTLVLDEPTNDLDMETLELLEERLMEFDGTLLLVSHDRAFINNVVTSTLVFEGDGRIGEYVGGYDDWLRQKPARATPASGKTKTQTANKSAPKAAAKKKLSYKDQRELEQLPALIERLETEQATLHTQMSDPAFYQQSSEAISATKMRLAEVVTELAATYERWETLEAAQ